jgi:hypothetical protein
LPKISPYRSLKVSPIDFSANNEEENAESIQKEDSRWSDNSLVHAEVSTPYLMIPQRNSISRPQELNLPTRTRTVSDTTGYSQKNPIISSSHMVISPAGSEMSSFKSTEIMTIPTHKNHLIPATRVITLGAKPANENTQIPRVTSLSDWPTSPQGHGVESRRMSKEPSYYSGIYQSGEKHKESSLLPMKSTNTSFDSNSPDPLILYTEPQILERKLTYEDFSKPPERHFSPESTASTPPPTATIFNRNNRNSTTNSVDSLGKNVSSKASLRMLNNGELSSQQKLEIFRQTLSNDIESPSRQFSGPVENERNEVRGSKSSLKATSILLSKEFSIFEQDESSVKNNQDETPKQIKPSIKTRPTIFETTPKGKIYPADSFSLVKTSSLADNPTKNIWKTDLATTVIEKVAVDDNDLEGDKQNKNVEGQSPFQSSDIAVGYDSSLSAPSLKKDETQFITQSAKNILKDFTKLDKMNLIPEIPGPLVRRRANTVSHNKSATRSSMIFAVGMNSHEI